MKEEIIIAGFGGQGVLSMGKILAYSGANGRQRSKLDAGIRSRTTRWNSQRYSNCKRRQRFLHPF